MPHRIPRATASSTQPPGIPDQWRVHSLPRDSTRIELGSEFSAMRGNFMHPGARSILVLATLMIFAPLARAQDSSEPVPITLGDFKLSGSATGGYRFTEVKGYQPQYQEMFD